MQSTPGMNFVTTETYEQTQPRHNNEHVFQNRTTNFDGGLQKGNYKGNEIPFPKVLSGATFKRQKTE